MSLIKNIKHNCKDESCDDEIGCDSMSDYSVRNSTARHHHHQVVDIEREDPLPSSIDENN